MPPFTRFRGFGNVELPGALRRQRIVQHVNEVNRRAEAAGDRRRIADGLVRGNTEIRGHEDVCNVSSHHCLLAL